jgi:hypothetical protein
MRNIIFVASLSVMLTACSGGGGGSSTGGGTPAGTTTQPVVAQTPTVAAQQLSAYVGTWAADCADHEMEYATITRVSDDTVKIASKVDYYSGTGCTGSVIGTQTDTGDAPAKYTGTADASVVVPPATTPATVKVDLVASTVPAYSLAVTGPGVTRVTKDGANEWCMNFDDESSTCIHDDGVHQGGTSNAALFVRDNQMFILAADGTGYAVDRRLTKK